jgi:CRISPR type III-B/RAMP module-associated protein Cmr3
MTRRFSTKSIQARLLTDAYFGTVRGISSGMFSDTLDSPTIYTYAGAIFTRLLEYGYDINNIVNECKIYGIYIKHKDDYLIPITSYAISKDKKIKIKEDNYQSVSDISSTSLIHNRLNLIIPKFNMLGSDELRSKYFISIKSLKEDEDAKVIELEDISKKEERTRTALDYDKKVPIEEKLFSLALIKQNNIEYCVDIEIPDHYNISNWIGHFGGESTLAEFNINNETPLLNVINSRKSNRYIAISHIALKLIDDQLICKFGKLKYVIGRIGRIGGWDIKEVCMKKIYACIEPGSIFCVEDSDKKDFNDNWYINLLNTAIPI